MSPNPASHFATALDDAARGLSHRGPDDSGIFEDSQHRLGLVQTRLSILDPSPSGHQPMVSEDGQVVLVFNGEIYNFKELRDELVAAGYNFTGHSDTEVVLTTYLATRKNNNAIETLFQRLNGIFALALWDAEPEELILARDAFGVKPLYYSVEESNFCFASEIKALSSLLRIVPALDADAIERYLSFLWCPGEGTPVRGVSRLGPGEALRVRNGTIVEHSTWYQLPVFRSHNVVSMDEAVNGTRNVLRRAVHRQMVADVPVGAFLSGGLDSSAVVALAKEKNPNIRCFTIEMAGGQDAGSTDDLPYAHRVARHLDVPLDVVRIDAGRMADDLQTMVAQLDEPLADPAPLNVLYISQLAREQGIKVLLSGAGGDDLFTGYRRHRAVMAERWWAWLPRSARQALTELTGALDQRRTLWRRLAKLFGGAGLEGDARLVNYFRWMRQKDLESLYSEDFRAALGDDAPEKPMLEFLADLPSDVSRLERMLALEQRFFLTDHNLLYTDKMSMAAGIEVRVPFLDLDLSEFAARIPTRLKQRGKEGKWVLKKAMEPYLPHDVIYRPKSGFGAPLRRWMRNELRELLGDILSEDSLKRRGMFNPSAVQRLIADNDAGHVDASYTLLSLLCVEIWCRHFLDTSSASRKREIRHYEKG